MTTISDLARQTGAQPYEIAAFLDLGHDWTDAMSLDADQVAVWRGSYRGAAVRPNHFYVLRTILVAPRGEQDTPIDAEEITGTDWIDWYGTAPDAADIGGPVGQVVRFELTDPDIDDRVVDSYETETI